MTELGNLGGESVGSMETVKYATWGYEHMPPNSIPTWPPNLEQFEMKYAHRLILIAVAR